MSDSPYVKIGEVADYFSVSVSTIRLWMRNNHIPPHMYLKAGNTYRFRLKDIEEELKSRSINDDLHTPAPTNDDELDDEPELSNEVGEENEENVEDVEEDGPHRLSDLSDLYDDLDKDL